MYFKSKEINLKRYMYAVFEFTGGDIEFGIDFKTYRPFMNRTALCLI